jgi:hypothetical protein
MVALWDTRTGRRLLELTYDDAAAAEFSPNGDFFVTAGADG